jgi:FlaA1/EpsC-like NDP-sugar epimerase
VQLANALRTDPAVEAVAFVDDNPMMTNMLVAGLPVYSPTRLLDLVRRKNVGRVILAMPSLSQPKQARLAQNLRTLGCEIQTIPSFAQLLCHGVPHRPRKLAADAFLNRSGLDTEIPGASDTYAGRRVLITGGGGSIGAELCRQILLCRPAALVILEISEVALYEIEAELAGMVRTMAKAAGAGTLPEIVPVLGSVTDPKAVAAALGTHRIEIVLHSAAYKHVPMLERNPIAGLENNVLGTHVLAEASRRAGVARFILISTDKAVRPVGILGASKRLAELVVQDLATRGGNTRFSMVRFGNVLGSSGSVVPLFEEQIARGGPVTLTDEGVTRYFMTISEAARLVLMAGSFTLGGDVFVLDMGDPVPIRRLARQMIEGAGYTVRDAANPDGDIEIVVTGLRPGEKLYEEMLIGSNVLATPHPKILRAQECGLSEIEVHSALRALRQAVDAADPVAGRAVIARWVEGYRSRGLEDPAAEPVALPVRYSSDAT